MAICLHPCEVSHNVDRQCLRWLRTQQRQPWLEASPQLSQWARVFEDFLTSLPLNQGACWPVQTSLTLSAWWGPQNAHKKGFTARAVALATSSEVWGKPNWEAAQLRADGHRDNPYKTKLQTPTLLQLWTPCASPHAKTLASLHITAVCRQPAHASWAS